MNSSINFHILFCLWQRTMSLFILLIFICLFVYICGKVGILSFMVLIFFLFFFSFKNVPGKECLIFWLKTFNVITSLLLLSLNNVELLVYSIWPEINGQLFQMFISCFKYSHVQCEPVSKVFFFSFTLFLCCYYCYYKLKICTIATTNWRYFFFSMQQKLFILIFS